MTIILTTLGLLIASGAAICIANDGVEQITGNSKPATEQYRWRQMTPEGRGSFQEQWSPGKWPMGIAPLVGFDEQLWMVGQKWAWSSSDGLSWKGYAKADWGERIGMAYIFFNHKLWMLGGMIYDQPQTGFRNDLWNSADGKDWSQVSAKAAWQPRREPRVVMFKNRLWLFGGAIKSAPNKGPREFLNDVWSSEDGINWSQVSANAAWTPRDPRHILVFKDRLWMIGSQGTRDVWRSDDGISWVQTTRARWQVRYAYGTAVFDDKIWVYGGQESVGNTSALNDVWYSADGVQWQQQFLHAPWSPRIPWSSIVFKDRLWLYGGKPGRHQRNADDIWAMIKE